MTNPYAVRGGSMKMSEPDPIQITINRPGGRKVVYVRKDAHDDLLAVAIGAREYVKATIDPSDDATVAFLEQIEVAIQKAEAHDGN